MAMHWRQLMDNPYLGAHDLVDQAGKPRDFTLMITAVAGGELVGEGGKKDKKPVASFSNAKKKLVLNSTNCKTIEQLYGTADYRDWAGKLITIYQTTTKFGRETKACIRIRPVVPKGMPSGEKIESHEAPPEGAP